MTDASPAPLHHYLEASARRSPEAVAVEDPSGPRLTYLELDRLAGALAARLARAGVRPGDRVGFCLPKSIDSIVSIYGILKCGAAYVPTDASAPASRNAYILADCQVRALIVADHLLDALGPELAGLGTSPHRLRLDSSLPPPRLGAPVDEESPASHPSRPQDLAYILYTSGSTGKPKGVMLSHQNATSFVDWCSRVFAPTEGDRLSSHAPLHFDLSILDVHLAVKHAATLVLIGEDEGKDPARLAQLIARKRITIWYSVPSILGLLAQYGDLAGHDAASLRLVLFAGEVFPVKHLRALSRLWPRPRYFNLYGPTETNVCTFYEVPLPIPEERTEPYPIGWTCSHLESMVIDPEGRPVASGQEGELVVAGPGVTSGYWQLPQRTAEAFHVDGTGKSWYRTGDLVSAQPDGAYRYLGRRDRMIKKRGYRIELGEIESCLLGHPAVEEVGVVATRDEEDGVRITAFLGLAADRRPSIIELKSFCATRLPLYMVPDVFVRRDHLPRTSTDKIDYQSLVREA